LAVQAALQLNAAGCWALENDIVALKKITLIFDEGRS
jgi:hypothetical protein